MKILQIIQRPQLRGAEIFACQLAQEFIGLKLKADVVYLFGNNNSVLDYNLELIPLQANSSKRLWDLKAYKELNKIIQRGGYDVVQANAADTLKYAVMSKLFFGWKAKLVFRNASLMGRLMHSYLQRKYNQWLLSKCDQIISVSENCRQDLIDFFPKAQDFSVTIHSGTYSFDNVEAKIHNDPEHDPIFIHVGSFVWEKNHEFLLVVFKKYFEQYGKGYLWLIGDGKLQLTIREKVKQMNLEQRVTFWGSRKDVIAFLKSADLILMPSVVEGMPGVILEALSCGVPVVASNAGGISEVIHHNINGFCMAEFSEDDYVGAMHTLLTDLSLRSRFVHAGKQLVKNTFNMTSIAEQFLLCYTKLVNKKTHSSL